MGGARANQSEGNRKMARKTAHLPRKGKTVTLETPLGKVSATPLDPCSIEGFARFRLPGVKPDFDTWLILNRYKGNWSVEGTPMIARVDWMERLDRFQGSKLKAGRADLDRACHGSLSTKNYWLMRNTAVAAVKRWADRNPEAFFFLDPKETRGSLIELLDDAFDDETFNRGLTETVTQITKVAEMTGRVDVTPRLEQARAAIEAHKRAIFDALGAIGDCASDLSAIEASAGRRAA